MKLFQVFKKKKYEDEDNVKRASREELGLLPEVEDVDEDIFVKPEEEVKEYNSTLKNIDSKQEKKSAPVKKTSPKATKATSESNTGAKKKQSSNNDEDVILEKTTATKNANKSNFQTKTVAENKSNAKEKSVECAAPAKEKATDRLANFEIKKAKDGRFVFNLYASNHVIVATSQIYTTSQAAVNGINSVITNAKKAPIEDTTLKKFETQAYPKWEIYLDKSEQFRFRLYAPNGNCICHSQGYTSKANCKNGIESIIKSCENSEITKAYLNKDSK